MVGVLPTGAGKCLGKGTQILMYDATTKNAEDIKVGDLLAGPDGFPRTVLSVCSGREMLYKVTPKKGDSYVVNESHVLSLKQTGLKSKPSYPCEQGKGSVVNLTVLEYLNSSSYFKHTHKGWSSGTNFLGSETNPLLPPYLLGLWLGDGASRRPSITTMDNEVKDYITQYCDTNGLILRIEKQPNNKSSVFHVTNNYDRKGSLLSTLRQYDLIENKHIPLEYLRGSVTQRLQLLAGLVDSDGTADKSGFDFVFKSERVARDVVFLVRSLGFSAYIKKCKKKCTNSGVVGDYFRFSVNGDCTRVPVKIARKKPASRIIKKDPLVTGIRLTKLEIGDYYGFEIDRDRLFMLGDFTVTHNTVTFSSILHDHRGASVAIAHRKELVGQISLALAREEVTHGIIGPQSTVKEICTEHARETGSVFYDPNASVKVAGVDTLIRRKAELAHWSAQVTLWVTDECHHLLRSNKWGQGIEMFPNARGLGVTATPCRADGKGLGRHAHGVFDTMVEGPSMRELIRCGFLSDYRIFAPRSDLDLTKVETAADGDFKKPQLTKAVRESRLVGDIVQHYLRIAPGKLGITFVTDVETAKDVARQYNAMGVKAEVVDAKTPARVRAEILRRFRAREITQLVNVDLFGEGFDLPAVEVVSFGRPTQSYGLYVQQFGRALRILDGKEFAIIIDHAGNVVRHGLPDRERIWSLDAREARPRIKDPDKDIPLRYCSECTQPYERSLVLCPYCGAKWEPGSRSRPEHVDGDLFELSPEALALLRGEVAKVDMTGAELDGWLRTKGMAPPLAASIVKKHSVKQMSQKVLREQISWWAAWQRQMGRTDAEIYRRFYFAFDTDIMSAQALGRNEATALAMKINQHIEALQSGKTIN